MFKHTEPEALLVCHADADSLLSSFSPHAVELDGFRWPSVEHYVQAMRFDDPAWRERIRLAPDPTSARKLGSAWLRRKRRNWKDERTTWMTRGMYIKCRAWPEVRQALLNSGDEPIRDTSLYDYYWGTGRDQRGENRFGEVLMAVRNRLREESVNEAPDAN